MINIVQAMVEYCAISQRDATLAKLQEANGAHSLALKIRATGKSGTVPPTIAIMDLEWGRDELLEDAQKIGKEIFATVITALPAMQIRAKQMRLIAA